MTTKTILLIILGIISFGVSLLVQKSKKKSKETRKKMLNKVKQAKDVENFKNTSDYQHPISSSIITLLEDFDVHQKVGKKINNQEIKTVEDTLQFKLPNSYTLFLKYFGDGGDSVYFQNIDRIQNYSWLIDYRKDLGKTIQLEGKTVNAESLLCLMTEDSNGGAWCWLTSEKTDNNEWALAYYNINDKRLHYKVNNFTEWLHLLVQNKSEVIRVLDVKEKLGLG